MLVCKRAAGWCLSKAVRASGKKSGVSGFDGPVARPRESGENEAVDGSKLHLQIHNAKDFYFFF